MVKTATATVAALRLPALGRSRWPALLALGVAILIWALGLGCQQAAATPAPPPLDVTAAAIMDRDTGQILYGRNAGAELPIASTTKLMTALITLEHAPLDAVFTQPNWYPAAADSQIGLVPGERMSAHDLLLALLLPSADDAAEDLAFNVGHGSVARFIEMMNAQARRLGLTHTHYSTPIGLDTPGNYSSATDLLTLARFVMQTQPFFRRAVGLTSARLHSGNVARTIINRNDLVGRYPWINGMKTGHTLQAGYVLVASASRDGLNLLSVVLGTPSEAQRDATSLALLRYGFANFGMSVPVHTGAVIAHPLVKGRSGLHARVVAQTGFEQVYPRDLPVRTRALIKRQLTGPLPRGARVGTLLVLAGRRVAGRIPLVLAAAVPAPKPKVAVASLAIPITLLLALVLVLGSGLMTRFGRERARGRVGQAQRR